MGYFEDIIFAALIIGAVLGGPRVFWLAFGSFGMLFIVQFLRAEDKQAMIWSFVMNDVLFEMIEKAISTILRSTFRVIVDFVAWTAALLKVVVSGIGWVLKSVLGSMLKLVLGSMFKWISGAFAAVVLGLLGAKRR